MTSEPSVLVVGAGISGVACARALAHAGIAVRIVDRGRVPGGRMASRRLHGRPVDLGAAYFTAPEGSGFAGVVADWEERGLARPWTRTLAVAEDGALVDPTTGPVRWAAPSGLRSLVADLGAGLDLHLETAVASVAAVDDGASADGTRYDAVVLAMPDPQAARLISGADAVAEALRPRDWEPTIAVVLGWEERHWPDDLHGAFVNGSDHLSFVADDGDRRGDGAPVLVAHSSTDLARRSLDDPDAAIAPVARAVADLLGIDVVPTWTHAHRWSFARPAPPHPEPFLLDRAIGVCGDGWGGSSSVGAAWTSGDALGRELVARLA